MKEYKYTNPLYTTEDVVTKKEYDYDIKSAKRSGFMKGFIVGLFSLIVIGGVAYGFSSLGDQKQYKLTEPDIEMPELKEDIYKEDGSIDDGNLDMETVDE